MRDPQSDVRGSGFEVPEAPNRTPSPVSPSTADRRMNRVRYGRRSADEDATDIGSGAADETAGETP
jgi:hypothetical protein